MSAASNAGRIGVFGASGSGKSSYVKDRWRGQGRVVVFDPMEEYGAAGFKTVRTVGAVKRGMIADLHGFRLAYVPPSGHELDALDRLCWNLHRTQKLFREGKHKAQITLIVEELNMTFPNVSGPPKCAGMAELCSRGRHSGIELVGLSQRIAEVSTRFRGNLTERVIFFQDGGPDEKAALSVLRQGRTHELPKAPLEYHRLTPAGELEVGRLDRAQVKRKAAAPRSKKTAARAK